MAITFEEVTASIEPGRAAGEAAAPAAAPSAASGPPADLAERIEQQRLLAAERHARRCDD